MKATVRWLEVSSGRGPEECCLAVALLVRRIREEANARNVAVRMIEAVPGPRPRTLRSALLALEGSSSEEFARQWEGTVQWIRKSPFRPHHRRKNWFVRVSALNPPESLARSEKDVRFERMRASGPGGQHVNKNETAIRVTHLPTGLSATAQEERSQHLNRKLALGRLAELLRQAEAEHMLGKQRERWDRHNRIERGNPIRVYEGETFRLRRKSL